MLIFLVQDVPKSALFVLMFSYAALSVKFSTGFRLLLLKLDKLNRKTLYF